MPKVVKYYGEFYVEIEHDGRIEAKLERADGSPPPPATGRVSEDQLLLRSIDNDRAKLRAGKLDEEGDLREFGRALYAAVLPGKVGTLLEHAVRRVLEESFRAKQDWQLRVVVEVDPESKVFDWPLELLYYDDGRDGGWLATEDLPITFSRRTQVKGRNAPPPERLPLRVLVVVSNPLDSGTSEEVLREVGALVAVGSQAGRAEKQFEVRVLGDEVGTGGTGLVDDIEYAGRPEWRRIVELGEDEGGWRPHVLHFIGHGKYEEAGKQGWLALVKDDEVDWCSAGDLIRALRNWGLRVVVLQACEKAQSGTEPAFMSLVDDLVRADIPAVVATQLSMTNRCAIEFAKGFYRALLEGSEVDRAVQRGRRDIYRDVRGSSPEFGTPVLFTYSPARIIEPARIQQSRAAGPRERDWHGVASEIEDLIVLVTHRDFAWEVDEEIVESFLDEIEKRMGKETLEWKAVMQGIKRIREGRIATGVKRLAFVQKRIKLVREDDRMAGLKQFAPAREIAAGSEPITTRHLASEPRKPTPLGGHKGAPRTGPGTA